MSKGEKKPVLVLKDLIGLDSSNVIKTFKSLDYTVKIDKEYSLKYPVNCIIDQNPRSGETLKETLELTVNSISQYKCFVYVDFKENGILKIEKQIGDNVVYSNSMPYNPPYMDYFFDYRPFKIKIYLNGILLKEEKAISIR